MRKILYAFVMVLFLSLTQINAQTAKATNLQQNNLYQYYIHISGITSKNDVEQLEKGVQQKNVVKYFLGNRYPVRYFLLKTDKGISKATFTSWIDKKLTVDYFEEGEFAKEGALMTGVQNKKKQ